MFPTPINWLGSAAVAAVVFLCAPALAQVGKPAAAAAQAPKLTAEQQAALEREVAIHVLNRCAFGPKAGQVSRVIEKGWKNWISEQLEPQKIKNDEVEKKSVEIAPSLKMSLGQSWETYAPAYGNMMAPTKEEQKKRDELRYKIRAELKNVILYRAINSERQLEEVVVNFWRNHFNVDQQKDELAYLCPNYEEEVIRKHAFGKFEDMLMACAHHPAMLIYLDNAISQRPLTEGEQAMIEELQGATNKPYTVTALERHRGLNENYARELLELHTLGVDNGYSQHDVTETARVLTGWSVDRAKSGEYGFTFRKDFHDPFPKRIMGVNLTGRGGMTDGELVLDGLAKHKGTSQFIAWKLCRYFVNDEPSIKLVDRVANIFRTSNGDLKSVYKAILLSPEFIAVENHRTKFKTPFEYAVSIIRVTGVEVTDYDSTLRSLQRMGQPIYECEAPHGYYDQAEAWCDAGVMVHRWDFAMKVAMDRQESIHFPAGYWDQWSKLERDEMRQKMIKQILPGGLDPRSAKLMEEEIAKSFKNEQAAQKCMGLLLGSPAFQQQ